MAALGWHGMGHGVRLFAIDPRTGEVEALGDLGHWVIERPGVDDFEAAESELSLSDTADWGPAEDWRDWAGGLGDHER